MSDHRNPIDEFESMFRRAEREPYSYAEVPISTVAIVVDGDQACAEEVRTSLLSFLPRLNSVKEWRLIDGNQYGNVNELLELIDSEQTDLIVTMRHLQERSLLPQHSLGVYLDVMTQSTSIPVLVLPGTAAEPITLAGEVCNRVMVVTDHIAGDHQLINYGVRMCATGGTVWLCHVEDSATFERYIDSISRIPEIDTDQARELIGGQLFKEANDFMETCIKELRADGPKLTYHSQVTRGHFLKEYCDLIKAHEIDLVVANTKDEDQLAMHGITYSLSGPLEGISRMWNVSSLVASAENHDVSAGTTYLFTAILAAMIAALAFEEKIHAKKSIIVGTFAGLCLILGTLFDLMPFGDVTLPNGHTMSLPVYIPGIDWGVITIILGASLFVEVTSRSGVFTWMAIKLTKKSGGDPWRLLLAYGILTVVFSAVLNNVTAMIIIGSLTSVSLKKLNRTDLLLGFLVVEGLLTNVGGLLTLISSVPNIIVGKTAGISFGTFFVVAAPYVVIATAITLFMGKWKFKIKALRTDEEKAAARKLVSSFDEKEGIPSDRFFWFSIGVLVTFIGCLAGQQQMPWDLDKLGMGFVALFFAGIMLLAYRNEVGKFYAAVDWDLLAFFAGLFVVINVMEHALVLDLIGEGIAAVLTLPDAAASGVLLASSAVASSVTDNIPLAAMLAKILAAKETATESPYWWCVIFGANLGGNITPIGSASTVVAMTLIHRQKIKLSFVDFVVLAVPFAVVQIIVAIAYVLLVF
eukprot:g21427.t1